MPYDISWLPYNFHQKTLDTGFYLKYNAHFTSTEALDSLTSYFDMLILVLDNIITIGEQVNVAWYWSDWLWKFYKWVN